GHHNGRRRRHRRFRAPSLRYQARAPGHWASLIFRRFSKDFFVFHNNYSIPGDFARIIIADPPAPVPSLVAACWPALTEPLLRWPYRLVATAAEDCLRASLAQLIAIEAKHKKSNSRR